MSGNLIVTTPKTSMRALAFQGIMVYSCFPQLRDMLMRKFGDEYVLLYSRPEENLADGNIDWYTPVQGESRRLEELPHEEAAPIYEKLAIMAKAIQQYGEELIKTGDPLKVTRGHILVLSLSYPDKNALYVVGGQPVFTCWGFGPGTPGVEGMELYKLKIPAMPKPQAEPLSAIDEPQRKPEPEPARAAAPVQPPASDARPSSRWGCLPWILPALLLAGLLALLFGGIGSLGALSGMTLFRVPAPAFLQIEDHQADITTLEAEIALLKKQIREKAAQCVPPKPKPEPKPVPPAQELVIPENAQNTDFLEGKWLCETGLINTRNNEPVQLEFAFGSDGTGTGTTYEANDRCSGSSRAHLNKGTLEILVSEQKCGKSNTSYNPLRIICEVGPQRQVICKGINEDGSTWNAVFKKIQ